MEVYKNVILPLLNRFDPEQVHDWTLNGLQLAQKFAWGRWALRLLAGPLPNRPVDVFGLSFPNVLGVAAGFDKDARVFQGLALLGFGHVEVGTLTPRPQVGNPRPRLFRLPADGALINRMGFPNEGVATATSRLQRFPPERRPFVVGVSLGKQKETKLIDAASDYIQVMAAVYPHADYLAVNISSPNTPGLRELQGGDYLDDLLGAICRENEALAAQQGIGKRPLLVKIAPDLTWSELEAILTAAADNDISGVIATNTTTDRSGLTDSRRGEAGGLSGRPLRERSTAIIAYITRCTGGKLPVIGVGGIQSAADVREKIDAGASLVQLYSGMVYQGPRIAGKIVRRLTPVR